MFIPHQQMLVYGVFVDYLQSYQWIQSHAWRPPPRPEADIELKFSLTITKDMMYSIEVFFYNLVNL